VAFLRGLETVANYEQVYNRTGRNKLLKPMIDGAEENFKAINRDGPMSQETKIVAE